MEFLTETIQFLQDVVNNNEKLDSGEAVNFFQIGSYLVKMGLKLQELNVTSNIPTLNKMDSMLDAIEHESKISDNKFEQQFNENEVLKSYQEHNNDISYFSRYLSFQIETKLSIEERKDIINSLFKNKLIKVDSNCVEFYQNIVDLFESSFWWHLEAENLKQENKNENDNLNLSHISEMNMKCVDFVLTNKKKQKHAIYSMFDSIQRYQMSLEKSQENKESKKKENIVKQRYVEFLSNFGSLPQQGDANEEDDGTRREIQSVTRNVLIVIGVFNQMYSSIKESKSKPKTTALFEKYYSLDLIDPCCISTIDKNKHESLYHAATLYDNMNIFDLLTEIDNDCTKFKREIDNKSAKEIALAEGQWEIYEKILFSKNGAKMKEKVLKEKNRLDLQRGTADRFLSIINKDSKEGMEKLVSIVIDLLNNRQPISDDMLLACWRYERRKKEFFNENKFENSKLWIAIENITNQVLQLPLNKIDFVWFKSFLFHSAIWYESVFEKPPTAIANTETETADDKKETEKEKEKTTKTGESKDNEKSRNGILYDKLISMVSKKLEMQKEYLRENVELLIKSDSFFKEMINFNEFCVDNQNSDALRQDNASLLTYPNLPLFAEGELKMFGLKQSYESNAYLSDLIVKSHLMNDKFQLTMKNDILKDVSKSIKFIYRGGPVKRMTRCVAKSESDYAMKAFPVGASIIDTIRASICVDSSKDLINLLKIVIERIDKGDTCLKRVLRIKNMFVNNKKHYGNNDDNNDWLYRYADLKLNILMEWENRSLIVECQFLLSFMLEAKSLGHGLYEIERNYEFVRDICDIMKIGRNKQEQLLFTIHSGNGTSSQQALSRILFCYSNEIDLLKLDQKNKNAIHYVCESGNYKLAQLILSSFQRNQEKLKEIMLMSSSDDSNSQCGGIPLAYAGKSKSTKMVEIVLKYGFCVENAAISDQLVVPFIETADDQLQLKSEEVNKMSNYCSLALVYMLKNHKDQQPESDIKTNRMKQEAMKWLIENVKEEETLLNFLTILIVESEDELLKLVVNHPMVDVNKYSVGFRSLGNDKTKDKYGINDHSLPLVYSRLQLERKDPTRIHANACELCLFTCSNSPSNVACFDILWQMDQKQEKKMQFDHLLAILAYSLKLGKTNIFSYLFDNYFKPEISAAVESYENEDTNENKVEEVKAIEDEDTILTKKYIKALVKHTNMTKKRLQVGCTLVINTAAVESNKTALELLLTIPLFNPNICRNNKNAILHCAAKMSPSEKSESKNDTDLANVAKEIEIEKIEHLECFKLLLLKTKCNSKLHEILNGNNNDENIGFCEKFPSRILIQLVVRRRYDCIHHFLDYIEKVKMTKNDSDNEETDNNNVTYMKLDPEVEDDTITINIKTIRETFIGAACRLADPVTIKMLLNRFVDIGHTVKDANGINTLLGLCMQSTGTNKERIDEKNAQILDSNSFECMKLIMAHPKFLEKYKNINNKEGKESGYMTDVDFEGSYTRILIQAVIGKKNQCARYFAANETSPEWCFTRSTLYDEIINYAARNDSQVLKLLFENDKFMSSIKDYHDENKRQEEIAKERKKRGAKDLENDDEDDEEDEAPHRVEDEKNSDKTEKEILLEQESEKFYEKYAWSKLQIRWHYLLVGCIDFEAFRSLLTQPLLSPELNNTSNYGKETVLESFVASLVNGKKSIEKIEDRKKMIKFLVNNDGRYSWSVNNYTSLLAFGAISGDYQLIRSLFSNEKLNERYDVNGTYFYRDFGDLTMLESCLMGWEHHKKHRLNKEQLNWKNYEEFKSNQLKCFELLINKKEFKTDDSALIHKCYMYGLTHLVSYLIENNKCEDYTMAVIHGAENMDLKVLKLVCGNEFEARVNKYTFDINGTKDSRKEKEKEKGKEKENKSIMVYGNEGELNMTPIQLCGCFDIDKKMEQKSIEEDDGKSKTKEEIIHELFECFKILLNQKNIDVNIRLSDETHIIENLVCDTDKNKLTRYLIENNGKYEWSIDLNKTNVLQLAALTSNYEILKLLIDENRYNININNNGFTPQITWKQRVKASDTSKKAPLSALSRHKQLSSSSSNVDTATITRKMALADKKMKYFKYMHNSNKVNHVVYWCVVSLMHWDSNDALNCRNFQCFELLLKQNNMNQVLVEKKNWNVITKCIEMNKLAFIEHFVSNKSNTISINQVITFKDVCIAAHNSNVDTLRILVKLLQDTNKFDINKIVDCSDILDKKTASAEEKDKEREREKEKEKPETTAQPVSEFEVLTRGNPLMFCIGADMNDASSGYTLLQNNFECFKYLLSLPNINLDMKFSDYNTLQFCVFHNRLQIIDYLLEMTDCGKLNINWNCKLNNGQSLLHIAADRSYFSMLKLLIQSNKFDINLCDIDKNTPLMLSGCTQCGIEKDNAYSDEETRNYKCFKLLLTQNDVNPEIQDKQGDNVLDLCVINGKIECMELLRLYREKKGWILVDVEKYANEMGDNEITQDSVIQHRMEQCAEAHFANMKNREGTDGCIIC